ncbi:RNA-directed DNA polymerase from mobile element jockey [Frankliniella fusca]|uniref:RNA-directed DNA polymerase from mobile element jockey n=1 Tax=Frankliniella fusca TaxID=407009 RepID=A0AAE1H2A3_9NEOP|nr:RNA-directed DNA polymerase from mobile element jockey [Frankliniella fusca]
MTEGITKSMLEKFCEAAEKQLKIIHINAQSLTYKCHAEEFMYLFDGSKHDIISVSETFYNTPQDVVQLAGYNVFVSNRTSHEGGGVAVYVRSSLTCKIISQSVSPQHREQRPDYIILEIKLQNTKILFACVYRPPKAGHLNFFHDDLFELCTEYENLFVTGDVNAHFDSNKPCDVLDSKAVYHLLETCNLERVPFGPTYHIGDINSSLDMIATNCFEKITDFMQIPVSGLSAHDLLYAAFMFSVPKYKKLSVTCRNFSKFNEDTVKQDIIEAPWENMFYSVHIDEKVSIFNEILTGIYDKHAPFKTFVIKNQPKPWVTQEIVSLIKQRDTAYHRYRRTKMQNDSVIYKSLRNTVNRVRRDAKIKYAHSVFNNARSSKDLWQSLKSLNVTGKSRAPCAFPAADDLNAHYASVSCTDPEAVNVNIKHYDSQPALVEDKFYFSDVTPSELLKAVKTVTSNATGVDDISIRMLKSCILELTPPILHLFNYSLHTSTALLKVVGDIREAVGNRKIALLVLYDFSNAFPSVHHGLLLSKLRHLGLANPALTWMKSYLEIEDIPVPYLECVNNLGLMIDSSLNWEKSATVTYKKSIAALHGLRRHKNMLPTEVRKRLVESLVLPIIDYGCTVTFGMLVKCSDMLQRIQNACARFVFSLPRDCHISKYLIKLNWLSVKQRRNFYSVCLLKKILYYKCPTYLFEKFTFVATICERARRDDKPQLRLQQHLTDKERGAFWIAAVVLWNQLPASVLNCKSIDSFKNQAHKYITQHQLSY